VNRLTDYAAAGYNHVPVMREVLADLDTPLSTYLKLANGPYSYLFESVLGGEKWGRYSIIGLPCRTVARVHEHDVEVVRDGVVVEALVVDDPLAWLEDFQRRYRVPEVDGLPRFTGGLVGYFGYDTVRYIEPRLGSSPQRDALDTPDILLMVSEEIVVFDNLTGKLYVIVYMDPANATAAERSMARLDELVDQLRRPLEYQAEPVFSGPISENDFVSEFKQPQFEHAVRKAKQYIVDGDIMQVVLSQRLSIPYPSSPLSLYRALRSLNPSPYMFYLDLEDFHVVGSSPEILVRCEDDVVTLRPIAGTRPRGSSEEEDRLLADDLLADPKERAEHLMLIDLGRNDLGRISQSGSVNLTEQMVIERYSHVMHIVSNVCGRLQPGLSAFDVLRACFPAGTVSGAPKIRAMEIIDELEPLKRGIYAGAVGYIGWNDAMDTAITIRTAIIKQGILHIQVGAGIVSDSIPSREWDETMNKGRAIFRAVAMASSGLQATSERTTEG